MEVTVFRMRCQGVEIAREQVGAEPRVQGFMSIEYWILENGWEPRRTIKELRLHPVPDAHCSGLLTLTGTDQTQLKVLGMVYVGTERIDGVEYPQAWHLRYDPRP